MARSGEKQGAEQRDGRTARLADKLRQNLVKRKAKARAAARSDAASSAPESNLSDRSARPHGGNEQET